ncbi:hypothetical protein TYRP_021321 [Tyrophagus putrescentiae]|nr:hypothetical protein TYRP_021321 [Tyrophagus putrescentiae]
MVVMKTTMKTDDICPENTGLKSTNTDRPHQQTVSFKNASTLRKQRPPGLQWKNNSRKREINHAIRSR